MKIEKGMLLKVKTMTHEDVFGDVIWEVAEVGLEAPEKERSGQMDGIKCVLLGGSGPAARRGFVVIDSESHVLADIEKKITEIIPADQKESIVAMYPERIADPVHSGTGCHEVKM